MRLSTFTTVIPLDGQRSLLMNHPKTLLDVVDAGLGDAIARRDLSTLDPRLVQELAAKGYVTAESEAEERQWLTEKIDYLEETSSPQNGPRNYCFVTSYRCNLACSYCFQSNEKMRIVTNRMLTMREAENGVAAIKSDIASGRRGSEHRTPVMLFGGEPLLPNQREVVEFIVRECVALGFPITATTNGMFLDQYEDLLGPTGIGDFQISLDGDELAHDQRRVPVNGQPTFAKIWANIKLALSKGAHVDLRCNIDKRNLGAFTSLVDFVAAEGYLDHPGLTMRYARVVPGFESKDAGMDVALEWSDIEARLIEDMPSHPNLERVPTPDVETLSKWVNERFPLKASRHCGAVAGNIYFGPSGEMYNCHETAGQIKLSIGRYRNGQIEYNDRAALWQNRRPDRLTTCSKCPFVLSCAGGCAARVDLDGEPLKSNCENYAKNFAASVRRAYLSDGKASIHDMQLETC